MLRIPHLDNLDQHNIDNYYNSIQSRAASYNEWATKIEKGMPVYQAMCILSRYLGTQAGIIDSELGLNAIFLSILGDKAIIKTIINALKKARLEHTITRVVNKY